MAKINEGPFLFAFCVVLNLACMVMTGDSFFLFLGGASYICFWGVLIDG